MDPWEIHNEEGKQACLEPQSFRDWLGNYDITISKGMEIINSHDIKIFYDKSHGLTLDYRRTHVAPYMYGF